LIRKGIKFFSYNEFCDSDNTVINIELKEERGNVLKLILCSCYMPFDSQESPPGILLEKLVDFCKSQAKHVLIGADANSHHVNWGSSDTNVRGESLMDFIYRNDLELLNFGNEPTFITSNRREVLDITFTTSYMINKINSWHVSDDISLSDHRYIKFNIESQKLQCEAYRNPKKTDWMYFRRFLSDHLLEPHKIEDSISLNNEANKLEEIIIKAYHASCPVKIKVTNRKCSWFTPLLMRMRRKTRSLWNIAKGKIKAKDFEHPHVKEYRMALTNYNNEIKKAKALSWKIKCSEIQQTTECARLQKLISKSEFPHKSIGSLKMTNGSFTRNLHDSLEVLINKHFPDSINVTTPSFHNTKKLTYDDGEEIANELINEDIVKWAIDSFSAFKSPGVDGILPVFLKEGFEVIKHHLMNLYKASVRLGDLPEAWCNVKVAFIPKPGKDSYHDASSFRPISLMSFVLKTLEKIIDKFIRDKFLLSKTVHKNQFAYQTGKSTEAALHNLVAKIDNTMKYKETGLGCFLDIEGAFNYVSFDSIVNAAISFGLSRCLINWILQMLSMRKVTAALHDVAITVHTTRGCPQGGCLSCLLWLLVIDDLLCKLSNAGGIYVQGFADDVVIYSSGKFLPTITNVLQNALKITEQWCKSNGLSINPSKTAIIAFTKKHISKKLKPLKIFGCNVPYTNKIKYLGVILDSRLSWNDHLSHITDKANKSFWMCRKMVGNNWGLKPKIIHWIYSQIIIPRIAYGAIVWWNKTRQENTIRLLSKLQRSATLAITGAIKSTPSASLEAFLSLTPLHLKIKSVALTTAMRLANNGLLCNFYNGLENDLKEFDFFLNNSDRIIRTNLGHNLDIVITARENIDPADYYESNNYILFFTDGSKTSESAGLGVYSPQLNIKKSINLGVNSTVFQAEVKAIEMAVTECIKRDIKNTHIKICSDSQAALTAVGNTIVRSKTVWSCVSALKTLSSDNSIQLLWVPGHMGIEGNEIADELAKKALQNDTLITQIPITESVAKEKIKISLLKQHNQYWHESHGQLMAKSQYGNIDAKKSNCLLTLSKQDLKIFTRAISGHNKLNYFMNKIRFVNDSSCRFCYEEEETLEHLLCECPAIEAMRQAIFGCHFIEADCIKNLNIYKVIDFIKRTKISI
jgi:ribonuclease HI